MDPEEVRRQRQRGHYETCSLFSLQVRRKRLARLGGGGPQQASPSTSEPTSPDDGRGSASSDNGQHPLAGATASTTSEAEETMDVSSSTSGIQKSASAVVMDVTSTPSASVGPSRSPSVPKSPTPGPFSALMAPATTSKGADADSGIVDAAMMDVEEEEQPAAARKRTASASHQEIGEAVVMTSLQNIFRVRLAKAGQDAPDNLNLVDLNDRLAEEEADAVKVDDLVADLLTEVILLMNNGQYPPGVARKTVADLKSSMFHYLTSCYERVRDEEIALKKKASAPPMAEMLTVAKSNVLRFSSLVLAGTFDTGGEEVAGASGPLARSPMLKPTLDETMPSGFTADLASNVAKECKMYGGFSHFKSIFDPLVYGLLIEIRMSGGLADSSFKKPLMALTELAEMRVADDSKTGYALPFCRLLAEMPLWMPQGVSAETAGREAMYTTTLGPLLAISPFAEESPEVAEKLLRPEMGKEERKTAVQGMRSDLEFLRVALHKLFHSVLVNAQSRESALDFLAETMRLNRRRGQMHVSEKLVAGDGFMLNLLSVMQTLCLRVKLEKVDPLYFYHPKSRLGQLGDQTRLKMTTQEVDDWVKAVEKDTPSWSKPANFHTECWYLTLYAHHLGIVSSIRRHQRRVRALR